MQIEAIELFHLRLAATDTVLVRLESGGESGWGEACVGREPVESSEWSGSVFACLRDILCPVVRGQSIATGDDLQTQLARFQGNHAAKSALDMAWWNLKAQLEKVPLGQLIGGQQQNLEMSVTLDVMPTIDDLLRAIEVVQGKHAVVLLKFRPGWDEQMLRAVRQIFPAMPLAIDCDGGCRIGQREMLYRLDDFMLRWIEQPLPADDLVGHAMLQESLRTPICLHQSISSLDRLEQALDLGSCRAIKIDPMLTGGITPAREIHARCQASKLPMATGGRYCTSYGVSAMQAIGTLAGFSLAGESSVDVVEVDAKLLDCAVEYVTVS